MATDDTDIETDLTDDRTDSEPTPSERELSTTETNESVGGLDENIVGALAYLFAPLIAIVLYFIEENNEFVRFHAVQSIIIFGGIFALSIGLSIFGIFLDVIPVIGAIFGIFAGLISLLLAPVAFILWIILTFKAYKGDTDGLPITGDMAKNYV